MSEYTDNDIVAAIMNTTDSDQGVGQDVAPPSAVSPVPSATKSRLLFMGLKRSGKSSIINVVLYKLPPTETVFIPATVVIKKHTIYSYRNFQLWDLPGQIDFLEHNFDTDGIFGHVGALVWVLDAQDDYVESVARLVETMVQLQGAYPDIRYSVFIHKVDSLSTDFREETVRDISERIMDDLNDAGLENPPITFYSTSVYDDSIFDSLSKVVQLLTPQLPHFETMLNTIAASCKMQKLYLFDVITKLYVAADTTPTDMAAYSLCADYIDTIVDLSEIYGWDRVATNGDQPLLENGEQSQQVAEGTAESFISGARGYCLYLKEMNKWLVLIGISREPRFAEEKPLVDYNVQVFQNYLSQALAALV